MKNPNLRLVWDNAADRGTLSTSSDAGTLNASNLRRNLKSQVWRTLSTHGSVICGWEKAEPVGCVVLAFTNFTAAATMRARGYTRHDSIVAEFDTGKVECAPPGSLGQFAWGAPLGENFYSRGGASLFAYGYGGYGVVWIPGGRAVRKLEILIDDHYNPDGYLEVGRLIVGPYWTPEYNFSFNHSIGFGENTKGGRTEAGDLRHDKGARWRTLEFSLDNMNTEDRASLLRILRMKGMNEPIFLSMFPENDDKLLEQAHQMWCKFTSNSRVSNPNYDLYATSINLEEM